MSTPTETPSAADAEPYANNFAPDSHHVTTLWTTPLAFGPDDPPWGVVAAIGVWLASVALLIFIQSFAVLPYAVHRGVGLEALGEFLQTDKTAVLISIIAVFPAHLLTLAVIWAVVTGFGKRPFFSALGWSWSPRVGWWTSAGLAVGLLLVAVLVSNIFGEKDNALKHILESSAAARLTVAALATFTAPLVEEMVYRGVLYSALQRLTGMAGAIIIVLILFTIIHVPQYYPDWGAIVTIGLLSFSLTLLRASTGRLLPCVALHLIFNGIQSVVIVAEPYLKQLSHVPH